MAHHRGDEEEKEEQVTMLRNHKLVLSFRGPGLPCRRRGEGHGGGAERRRVGGSGGR